MPKLRYEVDPHNRLIVQDTGKKSSLRRFRKVLDGKFKIGDGNSLIYHIKSPARGVTPYPDAPHQVKLRGKWSLTENHDLKLTLDKWRRQRLGDELTIQGNVIGVEVNSLLFSVTARTKENALSTHILKLRGLWQADKNNRLAFMVKKETGKYDTLTFSGAWEINKNHRLVYSYEKAELKRKRRLRKTIIFKGLWNITKKNALTYRLDLKGYSGFDFQTGLGRAGKKSLKFELGIRLSGRPKPVRRRVTLYGKWKVMKSMGLVFEIKYDKKTPRAIVFGADVKISGKDKITLRLKNELGLELDMKLVISKSLLGGGEAFIRFLKSGKESGVYAGIARRW